MFNFFKKKKKPLLTVQATPKKEDSTKAEKKPTLKLKNQEAEELRQKGTITIDGLKINLWKNHNKQNIEDQITWNKIESFKNLNQTTTGENGKIVITGVFQIPRKEVAEYAIKFNFEVKSTVSKFTDYIILGTENVSPSKIAKAIKHNSQGANIKFVSENTFLTMISENLANNF